MGTPTTTLWPLEPHTLGKHKVLREYLHAWLPILGSWAGRILFIDGFAGPGEYAGGEEGSPIIALRALIDHAHKPGIQAEVRFIFIEEDHERAEHLRQLVKPLEAKLPGTCAVDVVEAAFDETMGTTLDALDAQKARLAPAFVMIDPFGVSGTPMEVVHRILANERSEVYVSFMYEAINRFKGQPEFEKHLTSLFGTDGWKNGMDIEAAEERRRFFYDLYKGQFRHAGAEHVVHFDLYEGNRLVYAIFFATRHWKGADKMKQAIWKVAPFGNFAFHGTHVKQLTLGLSADFEPLRRAVRDFAGKSWVTIDDVEEFLGSDRTDYHTLHLRKQALVPMEKADEIEIDKKTRRKKRTYPAGTRLRFK
jgi:three-Cys-motif partner protein